MRRLLKAKVWVVALAMALLAVQPVFAHNCVSYIDITDCVPDNGCLLNPYEPDNQWWTYHYCVHSDRSTHLIDSWEDGPCCE